jgi:putative ABC transport system substrate-binding protein
MPLREPDAEMVEARKESLRQLGWVEGQNIVVEQLPLGDRKEARPRPRSPQNRSHHASNNVTIAAAKAATTTILIVMVYGDDPVRQGYVASLARPGGNITGSTGTVAPEALGEIRGKGIELLAECQPGLSRLAVLMDPNEPSYRTFWLSAEASARSRGVAVQAVEVREAGELAGAFARMVKDRAQAIQIIGSRFMYGVRGQIAELAMRYRLPTAYPGGQGLRRVVFFLTASVFARRGSERPWSAADLTWLRNFPT